MARQELATDERGPARSDRPPVRERPLRDAGGSLAELGDAATQLLRGRVALRLTFTAVVVGVVLAAPGGELAHPWLAIAIGVAWVALATAFLVGSRPTLGRQVAVSLGDIAVLIAAMALTDGSHSPVRLTLLLLPLVWPSVLPPRVLAVMVWLPALGYVALAAIDLAGDVSGTAMLLVTFVVLYAGSVALGAIASLMRRHTLGLARVRHELLVEMAQLDQRYRSRVSQQLHDGPLQRFLAVQHDVEDAQAGDPSALDRAEPMLAEAIASLRTLTSEMYPAASAPAHAAEVLRRTVQRYEQRGAFEARLEIDPDASTNALVAALGTELVTNVAKHARASRIAVRIAREDASVVLEVSDDGVGMSPSRREQASLDGHIGLRSIVDRVEVAGGRWQIDSVPGEGTTVRVQLPATG